MSSSVVIIAVFIYIVVLFSVARIGDRQYLVRHSWVRHPLIYALALGVYCTSWTFYGLVGTSSNNGWGFFPILLGPILLFTLGYPLLERIYKICRQEHIHSIADFVASRYGKRQGVAATVSVVVLLATIPYIALQLKAVSDTLILTISSTLLSSQQLTFVIGVSMILFTLLFGVKRLDMSGYHSGLMSVVAFESVVKLLVLMLVAAFALYWLFSDAAIDSLLSLIDSREFSSLPITTWPESWLSFGVETLLSVCAIFCLPRMFHITFVECQSENHLKYARWIFVLYLLIISACVIVIASVGNIHFNNFFVTGDSYVIALPIYQGEYWLAILAFLGGFSAATAMIIVATLTLSHMLSNDVVLPLLLKRQRQKKVSREFSKSLIFSRRLTVLLVILSAYFFQGILAENTALTSIGLIAFALVVQLAPAILFGLYWSKANASGLYAGLTCGVIFWFYTLMVPLLVDAGLMHSSLVNHGLFGISWLRPEYLFGLEFGNSFTRGVVLSLGANIIFFIWYSSNAAEALIDKTQSAIFTRLGYNKTHDNHHDSISPDDLKTLLVEFLGESATYALLNKYQGDDSLSRQNLVSDAQKTLAGVVGIASSQAMIKSLGDDNTLAVSEVVHLFGETSRTLKFNRDVLSASFEHISTGITIVDTNMQLIAWNKRYEDIFQYPEGMLFVGAYIVDIIRFNADRGLLDNEDVEIEIRKRLTSMREGKAYRVVRFYPDDKTIEIKGQPLPQGGYVITYDNISEFIQVQRHLEDANLNLEQRVQERTQIIEKVNSNLLQEVNQRTLAEQELREAKHLADEANASKTRFLAQASHDIMQPLNAANLYAGALLDHAEKPSYDVAIVKQLQSAIHSTESIISTLLEVSKLDSGVVQPVLGSVDLHQMLSDILQQALVQLPDKVELHYVKTSAVVFSDKHYLYRIVQNFVSNAIKYTLQGKVLIGCRRKTDSAGKKSVEICVLDSGMGISEKETTAIFEDFYRVNVQAKNDRKDIPGVGLGLSVVARFSELLNHNVNCQSTLGKGSCFSVEVPLADQQELPNSAKAKPLAVNSLKGMNLVYVDDEQQNLSATSALLRQWGCEINMCDSVSAARDYAGRHNDISTIPDVLLMDYQLDTTDITGIELAKELVDIWGQLAHKQIPVCIISATTEQDLPEKVSQAGFQLLRKPVKPGRLRALLTQFKKA